MKKLLVLVFVLFLGSFASQAQEIGVRVGSIGGNNAAVDAIFSLGEFSRLHADASLGYGFGVDVLYDFFYKPVTIGGEDNFNWYMGVGPSLYVGHNWGDYGNTIDNNIFLVGASFEIGLEYHFDFPLAVGVDYRPTFWIVEETGFSAYNVGAMARYVFGR